MTSRGVCLDFETFYSTQDYTLKKMTTEAYVRDPRFAAICMGYDLGDGESGWVRAEEIRQFLSGFDWSKTTVLCHNAQFDGLILSHHYGICPSRFACTLSMAALYPDEKLSLEALAGKFGLGIKSVPYNKMDGVHPDDMSENLLAECGAGAANDCTVTLRLLKQLMADGFPRGELTIVDLSIQMFTNPRLVSNVSMLKALQGEELDKREALLARLGASAKDMGSNIAFRGLLEAQGVEVAMKEGRNGLIPAFAATDAFMQELLEADEPAVRALAEARAAVKSNIRGTRAERLAGAAERGPLPVSLKYFGATRTGRWSGADKTNWQNFPRSGELSECIEAPPGCQLIVCDASQIEYRILCAAAGEQWPLDAFREGRDIYCEVASDIYRRTIVPENKAERFFGKKTTLSCGYGIGPVTLFKRLRGEGVKVSEEQCARAVEVYRSRHPKVLEMWREAGLVLRWLHSLRREPWLGGILTIDHGAIILPNGTGLQYSLRWDSESGNYFRTDRRGTTKIWGSALTGEVVQALASVFLREVLINIRRLTGLKPVCLRHDEAVYCVPEDEVMQAKQIVAKEFCRPPAWLAGTPLGCEIWDSNTYTKV